MPSILKGLVIGLSLLSPILAQDGVPPGGVPEPAPAPPAEEVPPADGVPAPAPAPEPPADGAPPADAAPPADGGDSSGGGGGGGEGLGSIDWDDDKRVKEASAKLAFGLAKYYTGNNTGDTPGNLPDPHFWWEAGAMFGTLVDYWHLTGDESYNKITMQALTHQAGPDRDYMPENQTMTLGNDDQGFWAMAAMSAAEVAYPDPPEDEPQYLGLAQAAFNEWVGRWETEHCGGGMRWQIFPFNNGFDYKNTISNGCFFNIAARLARYTGNKTYEDWAEKIYDWHRETKLITNDWQIHDGRHALESGGCGKPDTNQWTYNSGIFLQGCAFMFNHTEDKKWSDAVEGILEHGSKQFFKDGTLYERQCETASKSNCDQDQRTFKGYYLRWLASTTQMVPKQSETIMKIIRKAGNAAFATCTGPAGSGDLPFKGHDGTACGHTWLTGSFDGQSGIGEQMNGLDAVMYNLIGDAKPPVTEKSGGTSKGNPDGGVSNEDKTKLREITTADKAGAGVVTALLIAMMIGLGVFQIMDGRW